MFKSLNIKKSCANHLELIVWTVLGEKLKNNWKETLDFKEG
jgi:hypothetical protein